MAEHGAVERVARYDARMRRAGFVKKHVWVPVEREAEFQEIVERMRAGRHRVTTPALRRLVSRLRRHAVTLQQDGVRHLGIFGSYARGEEGPDSDVDILVEMRPDASLIDLARLGRRLEAILKKPVDLVDARSLRQRGRAEIARDLVEVL